MTEKTKNEENEEIFVEEPKLPKAKLSPTSNPNVFWDKKTGEMYYLEPEYETRWGSSNGGTVTFKQPFLLKLNDKRD